LPGVDDLPQFVGVPAEDAVGEAAERAVLADAYGHLAQVVDLLVFLSLGVLASDARRQEAVAGGAEIQRVPLGVVHLVVAADNGVFVPPDEVGRTAGRAAVLEVDDDS
jgi:hypothetical protein